MKPRIIGINGKKGSGKDTFANLLKNKDDYRVFAFAEALYDEVARRYHVSVAFLQNRASKETPSLLLQGLSPRSALQQIGQECRSTDPEFFVKKVARRMALEMAPQECPGTIFSDLRLPNELDFIRSKKGLFVRIVRQRIDLSHIDTHITEVALDDQDADITLENPEGRPEAMYDLWVQAVTCYAGEPIKVTQDGVVTITPSEGGGLENLGVR